MNNKPKKSTGRKIIRFIDNMVDRAVFLVCLVLFLLGSYGLYDSYMVYKQATDNSILKYKPGYETDDAINKEIEKNMVAWLTVDDTSIDYPVMQGKDNNEYLNKNKTVKKQSRQNQDFTSTDGIDDNKIKKLLNNLTIEELYKLVKLLLEYKPANEKQKEQIQ